MTTVDRAAASWRKFSDEEGEAALAAFEKHLVLEAHDDQDDDQGDHDDCADVQARPRADIPTENGRRLPR